MFLIFIDVVHTTFCSFKSMLSFHPPESNFDHFTPPPPSKPFYHKKRNVRFAYQVLGRLDAETLREVMGRLRVEIFFSLGETGMVGL